MGPREVKFVLLAVGVLSTVVTMLLSKEERRRGVAFIFAWLIPGAGHLFLGKWKKGLFLFFLLGATYLFGLWIVGFRAVSFDDNPFYYVGQYGSGMTFLLAHLMATEKAYPREGIHPSWFDPGLLYVCVVGLLNLVLMMNVLDVKLERAVLPGESASKSPSSPGQSPPEGSKAPPVPPATPPQGKPA